jgi:hypothetical protein
MTNTESDTRTDAALTALLKDVPVEEPSPGFFDRALVNAAHASARRQRNRWLATGFGGAIAAGIVAWLVGGMIMSTPDVAVPEIPGVAIALEQSHEVNFVFASARPLEGAMLTIELPDGIELEGFPGQRAVSWETSLAAGKNHLPLTLIATRPVDGVVVARLEHRERSKIFELRVNAS